jgi:competence protein ComGC
LNDIKKVFFQNHFIFYIKILLVFLIFINFVIILANPNISNVSENISKNGIDIVITLDIS